jgi:hypothetical protein
VTFAHDPMSHDQRRPGSFDPRTWEALPRYDAANPPDKNRLRPVLHTAGFPDGRGRQRCVRCGCELPQATPPVAGTVVMVGDGKSFDAVMCLAPVPASQARRK